MIVNAHCLEALKVERGYDSARDENNNYILTLGDDCYYEIKLSYWSLSQVKELRDGINKLYEEAKQFSAEWEISDADESGE